MKKIVLCAILLMSVKSFADAEKKEGDFASHKAEALAGIDKHIVALQGHKACVTAASDRDSMRKCHEKMKDFRQENRERFKEKHD